MRPRHLLLTLALCAVAGVSPAQPATSAVELNIPFEKLTLANGLQVILVEDRRLPLVATNLRFQVGSGDDPAGKAGFAHLFEHLYAFSPPASIPSPQSIGATQDGATTDPDRTTYYTTAPSDRLETLLALESERWRNFPSRLTASLLAKERSNVRTDVTVPALQELFNEMARLRDEPIAEAELRFARTAYESSLVSLFESTGKMAGTVGQLFIYELPLDYYQSLPTRIGATTAADLQSVARKYLQPSKVVVVAVGDKARIEPGIAKVVKAATGAEP